jgi:hypothetical protein
VSARPWIVLGLVAVWAVVHDLLVLALDRAGLVEQLLSPNETSAIGALVAAVALYGLRLGLVALGPGVVASALILALWPLAHAFSERARRACGPRP